MVRDNTRKNGGNAKRKPVEVANGFIPIVGAPARNAVAPANYPQWDFVYWRIRNGRVDRLECACGGVIEYCWYVYEEDAEAPAGRRKKAVFHMHCPSCGSSENEEQYVPAWAEERAWPRI